MTIHIKIFVQDKKLFTIPISGNPTEYIREGRKLYLGEADKRVNMLGGNTQRKDKT